MAVSYASYKQEDLSVAGEMIMVSNEKTNDVNQIYWKSGVIRKVCMAPKAEETRAMVEIAINLQKQ